MLNPGENNDHHLGKNRLGTDLIGAIQTAQVHIVAGPDNVHQTIAPDEDTGRSNGSKQKPEHGELNGLVAQGSALAGRINEVENEGAFFGGAINLNLAADKAEGEEPKSTVESGLNDLGGRRVESHDDRLEDEMSIVGGRDAVERCAGSGIGVRGGVGEGFELVESGLAGRD
jgi:hypothetical protein